MSLSLYCLYFIYTHHSHGGTPAWMLCPLRHEGGGVFKNKIKSWLFFFCTCLIDQIVPHSSTDMPLESNKEEILSYIVFLLPFPLPIQSRSFILQRWIGQTNWSIRQQQKNPSVPKKWKMSAELQKKSYVQLKEERRLTFLSKLQVLNNDVILNLLSNLAIMQLNS